MSIPQINIHQVLGQIGIQYQSSHLNINTPRADLKINYTPENVQLHIIPGELQIDQTEAFTDEGLRPPSAETRHFTQRAKQAAQEEVANTAAWGQRLIDPRQHTTVKGWLSRNETQRSFQITLMPSPFAVKVHYKLGRLIQHADSGGVHITARTASVSVHYQAKVAKTYVQRQSELSITPPKMSAYQTQA